MTNTNHQIAAVIAAYDGHVHELLTDLADALELSLAYVDRPTVEAHLERLLADADWAAVASQFRAMDFDDHVGDHGTFRTDWIEAVLERAGVAGSDWQPNATNDRDAA